MKVKILLFADDTCLFHSSKDISILQNDLNDSLNNTANCLKANILILNTVEALKKRPLAKKYFTMERL